MDGINELLASLYNSGFAEWMRFNRYASNVTEAIHVVGVVMVFGTILIVDLRLLGIPSLRRSFREVTSDTLKWTWVGFAIAVVTGLMLFVSQVINPANPAGGYYYNPFFRLKMLALLLAGINMLVFELIVVPGRGGGKVRTAHAALAWDRDVRPPRAARIAGLFSIVLWTTVIVFGRWIGYYVPPPPPLPDVSGDMFGDIFGGGGMFGGNGGLFGGGDAFGAPPPADVTPPEDTAPVPDPVPDPVPSDPVPDVVPPPVDDVPAPAPETPVEPLAEPAAPGLDTPPAPAPDADLPPADAGQGALNAPVVP